MSNSAWRNGGATLFLTTLTRARIADRIRAALDRLDPPNIHPHRSVELQRVTAGGRLRVAEHDADLHTELVDEDDGGLRAADRAGQLPQRLTHQASLKADVRVAHVAFDFGARHQRGDRVDHDHIDRTRANQRLDDLQRLLTGIRLRDQEVIEVDTAGARRRAGPARARRRRRPQRRRSSVLRR